MLELKATARKDSSKAYVNSLRKTGKIPGIVYGKTVESTPVAVEEREFSQFEKKFGLHTILKLNWGEGSSTVMVGEVQRDALRGNILHVDFREADMNTEMVAQIPIEWVGEEEAEKKSLILQRPVFALEVSALPANLPDKIEVDISELEVGETVTIGELKFGKGVEPVLPADAVVVSALAPVQEVLDEADEADAPTPEIAEADNQEE